jgi:hypothetical protein
MSTKRRSDTDPRRNDPAPSAISFFTFIIGSLVCVTLMLFFFFMPPRLILSSPSPDRTMKVELWTQGSMGPTWADLIWLNQWKKEHVYKEGGDEVRWSKDVEVVWSRDSRRFFVASTHMVSSVPSALTNNKYLYLTDKSDNGNSLKQQYPAVVLTYDIPKKELRHNLYNGLRPFDRRDLKGVDWVKKLPE